MAKLDAEDMLDSILDIMVSGGALNAKINEIEAEKFAKGKGLAPALQTIADDAYYCQTWTSKILNSSPAIFYGIEDVQAAENAGVVAKTYKIFIEVVVVDSGMTNDTYKKIARYSRALEELFGGVFLPQVASGQIKIDSVRPISFKLELDSNEEIKVGGISLTVTLV